MKWTRFWPETLLALLAVALERPEWTKEFSLVGVATNGTGWTTQKKLAVREKTRQLWYHGFDHYMTHGEYFDHQSLVSSNWNYIDCAAFPSDELSPLSCTGRGPDWDHPENIGFNDVAGNFSVTLIDVLDTLVVLGDRRGFENAVRNVIDWVQFDVNTRPQVFETTIRVLGGLLSGHIFANQTGQPFYLPWYRGELLNLAYDLGQRLLPAFSTPTGIPYARIHLRHGVVKGETLETCTAGAGSLILEFATLSRLTGDNRFEKAAYKAFFALWNRKSDIGLVGNTINTETGLWSHPEVTGIGAGVDSFYEYAFKWYVLSGEVEFLDVWHESYAALMRYARATDGFWYRIVNIHTGDATYFTVDSLSAFWPGLQVLAGDIENAIKSHIMYWNLWRRHSGLPEVWDINFREATSHQYPLRPEFAESTWYLYRATRDPFYLDVGERILEDLIYRAKVDCGLCGIRDLRTNARDDRMESFALSETLKYIFLLFDEENPLHNDDSNYVFTTEGHILTLKDVHLKPTSSARRKIRRAEAHQCPTYQAVVVSYDNWENRTGLVQGIRSRADVDYARELVSLLPQQVDEDLWTPDGWCERPRVDLFSYDFILSAKGKVVAEDVTPGPQKLSLVSDGFILHNVTGIRTHIVRRLDGKGYDVTKLGPHVVHKGQMVYVNDSTLFHSPSKKIAVNTAAARRRESVQLRFFVDALEPQFPVQADIYEPATDVSVSAHTALFGVDLAADTDTKSQHFAHGMRIVQDQTNLVGCIPYVDKYDDAILVVNRGDCPFLQKLVLARAAGAAGVVVVSDEDLAINPSAAVGELAAAGDLSDVCMVMLTRSVGKMLLDMIDLAEARGSGRVMMALDPERRSAAADRNLPPDDEEKLPDTNRVLYLNGHPLLNTRLLV